MLVRIDAYWCVLMRFGAYWWGLVGIDGSKYVLAIQRTEMAVFEQRLAHVPPSHLELLD